MSTRRLLVLPLAFATVLLLAPAALAAGSWRWPVVGPILRGFDPPASPYGSGHRGIDIATAFGSEVVAAAPGVVSFAGPVGGALFVSVDHGGGLVSSYSWLSSILVRRGDVVGEGVALALSGGGHPGVSPPHLHFGVRRDGVYVDPLELLAAPSVVGIVRLVPVP
ncbi:MAG TPA: M23 family metallopeptidase [Actinomycetota bacterium]|nr:M23 family metallopeptidase [Actinomycetota bacterium]